MNLGWWLGVALAIAGVIIGVFATRAYGNRSKRLHFVYQWTQLLQPGVGEEIEVTWSGRRVTSPSLLHLRVLNSGPGDIAVRDFEGGGVVIRLAGSQVLGLTRQQPMGVIAESLMDDVLTLTVNPCMLQSGESIYAVVLVDGSRIPVEKDIRLLNTKLAQRSRSGRGLALLSMLLLAGSVYLTGSSGFGVLSEGQSTAASIALLGVALALSFRLMVSDAGSNLSPVMTWKGNAAPRISRVQRIMEYLGLYEPPTEGDLVEAMGPKQQDVSSTPRLTSEDQANRWQPPSTL